MNLQQYLFIWNTNPLHKKWWFLSCSIHLVMQISIYIRKALPPWMDLMVKQVASGIVSSTGIHNPWRHSRSLAFIKRSRTSSAELLPTCFFLQTCCGFSNSSASSFFEIIIFTFPFASGEALAASISFSFCTFPKLNTLPPFSSITFLGLLFFDVKSLQSSPSHSIDDAGLQQFPMFSQIIIRLIVMIERLTRLKLIPFDSSLYIGIWVGHVFLSTLSFSSHLNVVAF